MLVASKRGALKIGESRHNITRLGDSRYRVYLRDGKDASGKPKRVYRYVQGTETDAAAVRDQLKADRLGGKAIGTDRQPLGQYLETWLRDKAKGNRPGMRQAGVSRRTLQRYDSLLRTSVIPALGSVPLGELTPEHLSNLYHRWATEPRSSARQAESGGTRSHKAKGSPKSGRSAMPLSPTTIHHRHVALKMALDDAVKRYRLIPTNPACDAIVPGPRAPMPERGEDDATHVLNEDQLAILCDAANETDLGPLVYVATMTGARLGELLALRVGDFDHQQQRLRIERSLAELKKPSPDSPWFEIKAPKSRRSRRSIYVGPHTAEVVAAEETRCKRSVVRILGTQPLLFSRPDGSPLRPSAVSQRFSALATASGFPGLRFHDLRHTHASLSLKRGDSIHVLSARLGHANISTTLRLYSHLLPGQDADLANGFETMIESRRAQG